MAKVTGLGGIFQKAKSPSQQSRWLEDRLGIGFGTQLYFSFRWLTNDQLPARTEFGWFDDQTTYFSPSTRKHMLNLRVDSLLPLLKELEQKGIRSIQPPESHDYGNFGWIMDPEGNKIELWEPVEAGFGETDRERKPEGHVTGLGGVFIKADDPASLAAWYKEHLGMEMHGTMAVFSWKHFTEPAKSGITLLSFFPRTTTYFSPSASDVMVNLRVAGLERLVNELRAYGEEVTGPENHPEGRFAWVMDPEGNKIELWESPAG